MTFIVAYEYGEKLLDEKVQAGKEILSMYGTSIYLNYQEEMTLRDLLYGLMMRSGNDAAVMIATYVAGSEEEFVNMMNTKAKEIGMKNTIFYNSSGLPTPSGNYSSTYDMALLTRYAMQYDLYREIVSTKKYRVTTNKKTYIWNNKNKLLNYDYVTGGKTGYTEESGRTLVSTASIDDMNLIVVTIRDSDDWNTHLELYDYARENYNGYKVLNKNKFEVIGDTYYQCTFYIKNDVYIPLKKSEKGSLISHIVLEKKDNYNTDDKVGVNQIYLDDTLLYEEDIYIIKNSSDVKKNIIWDRIKEWFNG